MKSTIFGTVLLQFIDKSYILRKIGDYFWFKKINIKWEKYLYKNRDAVYLYCKAAKCLYIKK